MNPDHRSELLQSLAAARPGWGRCVLFAWVGGLLVLGSTAYMFEVYDRVVNSRSHTTLLMLSLMVLFVYLVMELLEWARGESLRELGLRWDRLLTPRLYQLSHQTRFKALGVPAGQPLADFRTLRDFLLNPAVGAAMEAPVSLVFVLLLFVLHPLLGWAALLGALLQVGLAAFNERSSSPLLLQANRSSAQAQAVVDGALRHTEVIAAMGMLGHLQRGWFRSQQAFLAQQALASDRAGAFGAASKLVQTTLGSLLLGLGAYLLLQNDLPGGAGMMIVASVLGGRLLAPLVLLIAQWRAVVNAREAWGRLGGLMNSLPPPADAMPLPAPRGALSVEGLVAAAPNSALPILKGLQFVLKPGEVLAVIGPSAAGKSTLARCLVGLWPALQGKVRLDGVDVAGWNKAELGPHLGYLPQGVELLEGTLAQNVSRFGPARPAQLQAALAAAGLDAWVAQLPQGLETPLGPDGLGLSGGQRQRVALARALYGEPVLLVLDEPNAHLDEAGEQALLQSLQALKARGAAVVLMTHRSSVLAAADKILVLNEGVQQAFGARDEVLAAMQKAAAQAQQAQSAQAAGGGR